MRLELRSRYTNVTANDPESFALALDRKLNELKSCDKPVLDQNIPFLAHIFYNETVKVPENVKEEYEMNGETYFCADCPYFNQSDDKRIKYTRCRYSEFKVTETTSACLLFYTRLANGTIGEQYEKAV